MEECSNVTFRSFKFLFCLSLQIYLVCIPIAVTFCFTDDWPYLCQSSRPSKLAKKLWHWFCPRRCQVCRKSHAWCQEFKNGTYFWCSMVNIVIFINFFINFTLRIQHWTPCMYFYCVLQLLPNLYHVGGAAWAGANSLPTPIQETLESMAGEVTRVVDDQLKVMVFVIGISSEDAIT